MGGDFQNLEAIKSQAKSEAPSGLSEKSLEHLVNSYGSRYHQLFKLMQESPGLAQTITEKSPVVKAEIVYGVRYEMAQKLADITHRRTELWMDKSITEAESLEIVALIDSELNSRTIKKESEAMFKKTDSRSFSLQSQDAVHAISN